MEFGQLLNDFDSRMLNKSIEFFKQIMDIENDKTPIRISVVDNIGKGQTGGICIANFARNKIASIHIQIKNVSTIFGMIEALAHEMVHAKQFMCGDSGISVEKKYLFGFLPYFSKRTMWKGQDVTHLSYYNQPSEIEAHLLQKHLTFKFMEYIKDNIEPITMAKLLNKSTDSIIGYNNKEL